MHIRMMVVALAAAGVVAGCGGDDKESTETAAATETATATETAVATETPSLSKAEIGDEAGAICVKFTKRGQKLGNPDLADPAAAEKYFNDAAEVAEDQQDALNELNDRAGGALDDLTTASEEAVALLHDLADAAGANDQDKGAELIQKLSPISQRVDTAARAVGADECASA